MKTEDMMINEELTIFQILQQLDNHSKCLFVVNTAIISREVVYFQGFNL